MKKKTLQKNVRQGIIAVLFLCLALALGGLYWSYTRPAETTVNYTAFPYTHENSLAYRVHLLPNDLFTETSLEPGRAYISSLTDYIDTRFVFRFAAENEAAINGEYCVTASLTAYTGPENNLVWEKVFPLLPVKTFQLRGKEVLLQEDVALPFSQYTRLADQIVEETGFSPQNLSLEVSYDVAWTVDAPEGTIAETAGPKLTIPLRASVFTVEGALEQKESGGISAVKTVPVPYIEEVKIGFITLSVLSCLLLLVFFQITVNREEKDNLTGKIVSSILKKHRDRVVRCAENNFSAGHDHVLTIASFDDLLKIADELGKPILYQSGAGENNYDHSFYVFSEHLAYRYALGELFSPPMESLPPQRLLDRLR